MQEADGSVRSDDHRWELIVQRADASLDAFCYAVVTTGVFCRPSCRSRLPRRENVRFYDDWQGALRAGFRPCKRCRPAGAGDEVQTLLRLCEGLKTEGGTLAGVAAELGLSEAAVRRIFLRHLGVAPRSYQQSVRLNSWKRELPAAAGPLDAAFAAGIGSARGLYENATERLGMTPGAFARGGNGMELYYETAAHELGTVFVAGTEKGISFVALGEDLEPMVAELRHDYPNARILPYEGKRARWTPAVVAALNHPELPEEVPLDVRATAFQARVWNALKAIPAGETRTYSGLAALLGEPSATRAVARACATNRVSILIPCHRVVGVSGSLTGYRWGTHRKAALLERERQSVTAALGNSGR